MSTGLWCPRNSFKTGSSKRDSRAIGMRIVPPLVPDAGPRTQPPSASSVVVYVGRVDEGKGLQTVFEAWRRRTGTA